MRTTITMAALAIGALLLSVVPSHADTATATYVATPAFRVGTTDIPAGLGGYRFDIGAKPLKVKVEDLNGTGQGITVCQENTSSEVDGDLGNICGDGGDDISISYCNDGKNKDVSDLGFTKNAFTVFINNVDVNGCPQVATAGTITITF